MNIEEGLFGHILCHQIFIQQMQLGTASKAVLVGRSAAAEEAR